MLFPPLGTIIDYGPKIGVYIITEVCKDDKNGKVLAITLRPVNDVMPQSIKKEKTNENRDP